MTPDLRARVLALLERIQWGTEGNIQTVRKPSIWCPCCGGAKPHGATIHKAGVVDHAPDCALAALIEELKR